MFEKVKIFVEGHQKAVITAGMIVIGTVVGLVIVGAAMNEQEENAQAPEQFVEEMPMDDELPPN